MEFIDREPGGSVCPPQQGPVAMFALALVVLPFSDTDPAEAIRASLARYRRGKGGEVPDEWLAFDDITPFLREGHEASMTFTAKPADSLSVTGQTDAFHLLDHRRIRDEMERRGLEEWSIRFADEMDLDAFCAEFSKYKVRDAKAGLYGLWLNGLGRWDWWDLGGRFDGAILGERREGNGRPACRISSGDTPGRQVLANVEDALTDALGQEPFATIDVRADRNVEVASTVLETLRTEGRFRSVHAVVLPPGSVEDELRWMDTWPAPRPREAFVRLGLAPDAPWAEVVEAALGRFADHWVAGVAYHL